MYVKEVFASGTPDPKKRTDGAEEIPMDCSGETIDPHILGIPTIICHFQIKTLHLKTSNPYKQLKIDLQKNRTHMNSGFIEDIQFYTLANSPRTSH